MGDTAERSGCFLPAVCVCVRLNGINPFHEIYCNFDHNSLMSDILQVPPHVVSVMVLYRIKLCCSPLWQNTFFAGLDEVDCVEDEELAKRQCFNVFECLVYGLKLICSVTELLAPLCICSGFK